MEIHWTLLKHEVGITAWGRIPGGSMVTNVEMPPELADQIIRDHNRAQAPSDDEVRAAAERHSLCNYDHRGSIATVHAVGQPHCQRDGDLWPCDIQIVASYALEAGREVERLRAALIGVAASGDVVGEERCWCPDSFFSLHEHAPECQAARVALSTPGEQED